MNEEYRYLLFLFIFSLVVFIIMTGIVLLKKFSEKKRKAFQIIDEQIRQNVDDALSFLEDETGKI